jgi:hypothetical protein
MRSSLEELLALGPDGVQLTPGNLPTDGFREAIEGARTRTHHGFAHDRRRQPVWDGGRCLVESDSVHPCAEWREACGAPALETMYPGAPLGTGGDLTWAMDHGVLLAVDVSHLYIQWVQGVLTSEIWRRLQGYDRIAEVHVSANDGKSDRHWPIAETSFGLEWARDRAKAGTPLVLEAYFHRLSKADRRRQVDIARGES